MNQAEREAKLKEVEKQVREVEEEFGCWRVDQIVQLTELPVEAIIPVIYDEEAVLVWFGVESMEELAVCEACQGWFVKIEGYYEPDEYAYCSSCCRW